MHTSFSDPVGIRTQDPQLRRLLLYPAELPDLTIFCNLIRSPSPCLRTVSGRCVVVASAKLMIFFEMTMLLCEFLQIEPWFFIEFSQRPPFRPII